MDKIEKLNTIDKFIRELEDIQNSQVAVLKKVAQIEADNINVGIALLEKHLPDVHEHSDKTIEIIMQLQTDLQSYREEYVKKNNLENLNEEAAS